MDREAVTAAMMLALLLLLSQFSASAAARHGEKRAWWEEGEGEWRPEEENKGGKGMFVLDRLEKVVESDGGQVHVVRGQPWPPGSFHEGLMHIGFINMEPKTLLVPQYLDTALTLFVQLGTYAHVIMCSISYVRSR
jgi:hypothetical protein